MKYFQTKSTKMQRKFIFFILGLALLLSTNLAAQIHLQNASFEGESQDATVPVGWHACARGSTPDILPDVWGVYTEPSDGDSFLGLITREDGSFESIGQRLPVYLKKDTCYAFSLDLAFSKTYAGYNKPIKLRIWGGKRKNDTRQLLLETDFIEHTDWKRYVVSFFAKQKIKYLIFEAFYVNEPVPRRGNILLDNISAIKKCDKA